MDDDDIKLSEEDRAENIEFLVVTRDGWEAQPPKKPGFPMKHPVQNVVMAYNTEVKPCFNREECVQRMRELQQLHMDKGLDDIHYNFAIGSDGTIYEGRGWDVQPSDFYKNPDLEEKSVCFGIIGDSKEDYEGKGLEFITGIYFANHGVDSGYVVEDYEVREDDQTI